jgi:rod shape-determining protein MreD
MSNLVKNIIRFALFILFQVFVLGKIPPLHQFVVPYLYFLFILWLPFKIARGALTLLGFLFGLGLDLFTKTPGLHAAACTLIAYVRPFLISLLMSFVPYAVYVLVLTFLHHSYLVFMEWLHFGNFFYFLGKVFATTAISLLLILITETLFVRKAKYRTNVA